MTTAYKKKSMQSGDQKLRYMEDHSKAGVAALQLKFHFYLLKFNYEKHALVVNLAHIHSKHAFSESYLTKVTFPLPSFIKTRNIRLYNQLS